MRNDVVVIGSGMMGSGIAACSAAAGNNTLLVDTNYDRAKNGMNSALEKLSVLFENDLITEEQHSKGCGLIHACDDMESALSKARFVIEAVTENLELKKDLFEKIDKALPSDIPIASNTSGLRITDIAEKTSHPERTVTAHFWFPAHLVPLVEVVMGDKTEERFALQVKDELLKWNKCPVIVKKDLPGQLANRILQAVIREAVNIVEMGLASPEDVDTAVKMGMGIRFPVWGPLEHIDAVGLDLGLSVQDTVLPGLSTAKEGAPVLKNFVAENQLGHKTGQGFYDWNKKDMSKLQELRDSFIINAVKFIKNS